MLTVWQLGIPYTELKKVSLRSHNCNTKISYIQLLMYLLPTYFKDTPKSRHRQNFSKWCYKYHCFQILFSVKRVIFFFKIWINRNFKNRSIRWKSTQDPHDAHITDFFFLKRYWLINQNMHLSYIYFLKILNYYCDRVFLLIYVSP